MRRTLICGLAALLCLCVGCGAASSSYEDEAQIAQQHNTYNLPYAQQAVDNGVYAANVTFEGMDTLWGYDAPADGQIEVAHQLWVKDGRAKLVLVTPDGVCTTLVEDAGHGQPTSDLNSIAVRVQAGHNRIRLVTDGESEIELQLQIDCGNFVPLGT